MKTRAYISGTSEGWTEVSIPTEFQKFSYDQLVNRIYDLLSNKSYKGLLITENPSPFQSE